MDIPDSAEQEESRQRAGWGGQQWKLEGEKWEKPPERDSDVTGR